MNTIIDLAAYGFAAYLAVGFVLHMRECWNRTAPGQPRQVAQTPVPVLPAVAEPLQIESSSLEEHHKPELWEQKLSALSDHQTTRSAAKTIASDLMAIATIAVEAEEVGQLPVAWESMGVRQLRKIATDNGYVGAGRWTKARLVQTLSTHQGELVM